MMQLLVVTSDTSTEASCTQTDRPRLKLSVTCQMASHCIGRSCSVTPYCELARSILVMTT
jgi:hypothetical protein